MPPKLLKRPVSAKQQTKPQPKTKQKGKGKVQTVVEAPKTAQDLVLNQKQSLELVKIGVNAAICHFVFYRRFFPSNCYKTRIYNANDANPTYDKFMSGTNIPRNLNLMEAGDEILSFNTIVRGSGNQGAEKLLDWLEFGVSNAVDDKCLAKLQLSVYREEVVLEQLVEAFTINFTYKDIGNNTHVQISASVSNEGGQIINLGKAQEGLRELVKQVMNCSRDIKGKSSGRKVSMQLLYNDNPRPKNEYRGFRAASSSQILPDNCGVFMGEMNNGFNELEVKYYDAPAIDSHLKAKASRSAKETSDRNCFAMTRSPKPTTPEAIVDDSQSSSRHTQFSQDHGTQESTVRWINQVGHTRGSDDMDTQLLSNHASQSTTFGKHTTFPEPKELDDMDIEEESEEEGEAVRCECTNYDDRENLIQCEKCRNFCHSQCYGYSKGSVGANFECYECLLAESEQEILFGKMYPLCTRRRMVYYLKNNGFNDMEGLCQYMSKDTPANVRTALTIVLDLNYQETQDLVEALKTEGIIKKCTEYSKEPFQFSNLKRLLGELFDPSKHISHTKLFVSAAASKVSLPRKSQAQVQAQLTPLARRLVPSDGPTRSGLRSEGSSTQTPSSWRSLHNDTLRRSPRVPAQSTPQQSNKRAGDEISENATKKRRAALNATSPFSVRSNSLH